MKICLVQPPTFVTSSTYPYNLDCIASSLASKGHDIYFVDVAMQAQKALASMQREWLIGRLHNYLNINRRIARQQESVELLLNDDAFWDGFAVRILEKSPDLVGLSCYSSSMSSASRLVEALKRASVETPIVLGGIHPTSVPNETMERLPLVDYIVMGEGEESICELADAIAGEINPHDVKGICFREGKEIVRNDPRPLLGDFSSRSIPQFLFVNEENYDSVVLLTSLGCPFHCDYCASKVIFGKTVRFKPAEIVGQEIENLLRKKNVDVIRFGDDTFTVSKKHMLAIRDELEKRNIKVNLSVGSRIDTLTEEKLEILNDMGVRHISFGIETGSERIQSLIHKGLSLDIVIPTIKLLDKYGITSLAFFIVNHPHETEDDMGKSLEFINQINRACKHNTIEVNTGFPYPATPWWDYCREQKLTDKIDFYSSSHKYNHQHEPNVNMTVESDETVIKYYEAMNKASKHGRFRYLVKMALMNPGKAVNVLRRIYKPNRT